MKKYIITILLLGTILIACSSTDEQSTPNIESNNTLNQETNTSETPVIKESPTLEQIEAQVSSSVTCTAVSEEKIELAQAGDWITGVTEGYSVTLIEYGDYQCPHCANFAPVLTQLLESYPDDLRAIYRHYPIISQSDGTIVHDKAALAAQATEAAGLQDKFWELHEVLFEKQAEWQRLPSSDLSTTLMQYAVDLGLQTASFETCLNSEDIADEVNQDYVEAGLYGATGTPTFFIGTEKDGFIKLVGAQPFAVFQNEIDNQLG